MALNLNVPPTHDEFSPRICVVGVGGAGGNAINNMISSGLQGVEFYACNTDAQDLSQSLTENRIQLGPNTTRGLGAGMQPQIGASAAQESLEEILHHLEGANMVFVTAGMGGGTGTGAAPVIARALRDKNILTVGVVTKPFQFEGMKRAAFADEGIANMTEAVDTLIVIPNQNLFRLADERTTFADAFKMADNVLLDGVRSVSDLIVKPGIVNLDFADVRTLMTLMGKAMMGTGEGEGETRALDAANRAIANPLLDDMSLDGAQGVLINVSGGLDVTLYEVDVVANQIRNKVDPDANIIFGSSIEEDMDGAIRVSVVATGIDADKMARATMPMPGGPGGPSGTPPTGGPGGGSGGGSGGGIPRPGPQPAPQPTAPQSPFGRSPFAFRNNPGNAQGGGQNGPTSHLAPSQPDQADQGAPSRLASAAAAAGGVENPALASFTPASAPRIQPSIQPSIQFSIQPAGQETPQETLPSPSSDGSMMVSPNYAAVPPASSHMPEAKLRPATPEPSLFDAGQQAAGVDQTSQTQPMADAHSAPATGAAKGGLFSRFAPPREGIPAHRGFAGGAAVAAANTGLQEVAEFEAHEAYDAHDAQQQPHAPQFTSPFGGQPAPQSTPQSTPQPSPQMPNQVADLDAQPMPAPNPDLHQAPQAARVVDLDDSASSGLENYDESYKSVPAFLRHQNN